jgi:MYXO-CTERM domain-containing protein
VLPTSIWEDGGSIDLYAQSSGIAYSPVPGSTISLAEFSIAPGVTYQISASSLDYLPGAGLDSYTLTLDYDTPDGTVTLTQLHPASVPEPATPTLALAMAALAVAAPFLRRRK